MSSSPNAHNRVRDRRSARNWSQSELAERAGISRTAVSAIEAERLVPSVAAALGLAKALECTVEELFGTGQSRTARATSPAWAWLSPHSQSRFWCASVGEHRLFYPVEATPLGEIPHDGVSSSDKPTANNQLADSTLVMASCDPAVGLLAHLYEQTTGYRLIVFPRSSRQALELLQQGLVHVAGVHLSTADSDSGNATPVREIVSEPSTLLRVASWEDGVAVGASISASTIRGLLRDRITWIGREPGSGARQCLDELFNDRPAPRRLARDHRGVAEAIRCGWADAGVCLKLVADEAGLRFLPVRSEGYDLCFTNHSENDPRIQALVRVIQSNQYRHLLSELPGYDSTQTGASIPVSPQQTTSCDE